VHVTLTGVRGLIAPSVGMLCYQSLEAWHAGLGIVALLLPLAMVIAGAIGFVRMREGRRAELARDGPCTDGKFNGV